MKKTNEQTNNNKNRISTSPFISAFFLFIYWYKLSFMFLVQKEKKLKLKLHERKFVWIYMVRQSV